MGEKFSPVFKAQMEMVDAILELENEIRRLKNERKTLKAAIPRLKSEGNIEQVCRNQMEASKIEAQIAKRYYIRDCILFIGDTMAVKILDVDTVSQFACYPSPGFLSGKEGLDAELEAAHNFYHEGYVVVLNDLTHCLRVGDLTL